MGLAERGLKSSQRDPKGVTECPICGNLVSISTWPSHKSFEMKSRKGTTTLHADGEGYYRCIVAGCTRKPAKNHGSIKRHMLDHSLTELRAAGLQAEVRLSNNLFDGFRW